jgi:uncharacterized protein YdhG (YjbR/CyaY superfamily)
MTATTPTDVDTYLATLPADRHEPFTAVRERIHASVAGLGETISYKMPAVTRHGDIVLYFAAWKHHIGMYPIPTFDGPLEARVAPFRAATDTIRFPYNQAIPDGLIEDLTATIVVRHHDQPTAQPTPGTVQS